MRNIPFSKTYLTHVFGLSLAVCAIYWPVYQFSFLYGWDDQWFVTNHYTEGGFGLSNLWEILSTFHYGQYAPLNQLYYTLLYTFFGYDPFYFHIASVCLHLANVLLVYSFLSRIVPKLRMNEAIIQKRAPFFSALFFAILPINVEPVAWVSASKVLIYTLFYLLALLTYCKYLTLSEKPSYYYLTLFFFTLSFGAKEQAVVLPACLLLLDWLYGRNLKSHYVLLEKLPFLVLGLLYGITTIQSQGLVDNRSFYSLYERIFLGAYTLMEYYTKSILPVNLSFLYPFPFVSGETIPWWLWIHVLAIPIILYCFYKYLKRHWVFFGLSFFLFHIGLVINFFSLARHSVIADRYAYVSTIGISLIIAISVENLLRKIRNRKLVNVVVVIYLGILMVYSSSHVFVWRSTHALKKRLKTTIEQRADFSELKKYKL